MLTIAVQGNWVTTQGERCICFPNKVQDLYSSINIFDLMFHGPNHHQRVVGWLEKLNSKALDAPNNLTGCFARHKLSG